MRFFKRDQKVFPLRNRFEGGPGVSLYLGPAGVDDAEKIVFRKRRFLNGQVWFPLTTNWNGGQEYFLHDSIVAQVDCPASEITYTLPASYDDVTFWLQLRTFESGLENQSIYRPQRVTVDGDQNGSSTIDGTAIITGVIKLDDGGMRLQWLWLPAVTGIQPTTFVIRQTSGPTVVSDVETTVDTDIVVNEADVSSLQDAGLYGFNLLAVNGATSQTLASVTFTADATGPTAAASVSAAPC